MSLLKVSEFRTLLHYNKAFGLYINAMQNLPLFAMLGVFFSYSPACMSAGRHYDSWVS